MRIKFENWKDLINANGVTLNTYKTPNGSWVGSVDTNGELLGFVDVDWNFLPMGVQ